MSKNNVSLVELFCYLLYNKIGDYMKLNNKGFAISTIMYVILMMAILLIVSTLFILGNRKIIIDKQKNEILDNIYNNDNSKVYIDASGANAPELMDALTPVVYDDETSKWKVVSKTDSNWYSYNEQKWANAVIVKEGVSKDVGTLLTVPSTQEEITSSDILAMFVWIPRYEYKIDTTDGQFGKGSTNKSLPGEIEVNFISKNITYEGTNENGYRIHPAFNFDGEELTGIWVGKFETSHIEKGKTNNDLECSDENCTSSDGIRILPNVISLRYNNVANFFFATRSMSKEGNIFKIDKSKTDTHIIKDSEWGAVAYLSQSKYGKYGNDDYLGVDKEVYASLSDYTGGSSGTPQSTEDAYHYDVESSGTGASTTGNITGVYDMNGNYEYAMGFYLDDNTANYYGSSVGFDKQFFEETNNLKYFDEYKIASTTSNSTEHIGRALDETLNWYDDFMDFVGSYIPWSTRGMNGIFGFCNELGGASSSFSSRIVFVPTTGV